MTYRYIDSEGNRENMTDAILASHVFLALATRSYLEDIEKGDERVVNEVALARTTGKALAIVWVVNDEVQLTEEGRERMRKHLRGFPRVLELEFDVKNAASFDGQKLRQFADEI